MSDTPRTSRFEAIIAIFAMALVTAASVYFVNPTFAAQINALIPQG
ncbi:MAG: hypothetical protein AB7O98_00965 [Hyphomonadaceae bacterium]